MKTNFFLVRHGETFASLNSKPGEENYGDKVLSADILPESKPIIAKIGLYLKNVKTEANLVSPIKRCIQTSEILEKTSGKTFKIDERLKEYYEETFDDLRKRVDSLLNEVKIYQNVLVCTHGAVISAIKHLVLKDDFKLDDIHDYPVPGTLIIIKDNKLEEIDFN